MADVNDQIETLPLLQRLALSYAPQNAHLQTLGLMALDNRLAGIVSRSTQPMLAQIRLAWWREQLAQTPQDWPKGEPLLALLRHWEGRAAELAVLADGWERVVSHGSPLSPEDIQTLAEARGAAFGLLAEAIGHPNDATAISQMAHDWALADQATHLKEAHDRETARDLLSGVEWQRRRLPRALRPVAVLNGLAARSARKGTGLDQLDALSIIPAMRIGLFGI